MTKREDHPTTALPWNVGAHGHVPLREERQNHAEKTPHPALRLRGIATLSPGERVPEVRGRVRGHCHGFWEERESREGGRVRGPACCLSFCHRSSFSRLACLVPITTVLK